MHPTSRRSSTPNPFETELKTSIRAITTPKPAPNSPNTDPTWSILPRTSSIDVGWDSVESETVTPANSEIPESGIRQSDAAIDLQTLRPGIVPTFTPSVRIFEAAPYNKANQGRRIARRILEGAIVFSIGIACGIGLHARVIPLMEHSIGRIKSARSIQSHSLPVNTKSLNSVKASAQHTREPRPLEDLDDSSTKRAPEPAQAEGESNTIKSIGGPINSVSNSGTKEVAVRHRPIIRRSKIVASDNPY